jgi:hypothetical protein
MVGGIYSLSFLLMDKVNEMKESINQFNLLDFDVRISWGFSS